VVIEATLVAAWEGLRLVFAWPNVLYPLAGTLLAMAVAFLPGVSGVTLMALAVPFTLTWDPLEVVLLFGGLVGGATFMGSVTAILFNVPGTGPSAATLLDGYPLAQQGQARTALGCAALSSAMGSSVGVLLLVLLVPFMTRAILAFGPLELLLLVVWGLATIVVITRGGAVPAAIATGIGLLLSLVGHDPLTGERRFTFGSLFLWDGLSLVPVMLGIFSIAEMADLAVSGRRSISGAGPGAGSSGSVLAGARALFQNVGLFLRCSVIGTVIGAVPGIGGTVASFMAYGHAVQSARGGGRFGQGDIRGVLAPEAAHDAKDAGALVPVLAFGIPGSDATAVLMAALVLHGLAPGRELMTDQLPLVFVLIWSLFLSNWVTSLLGLALVSPLSRLTSVRVGLIVPLVLALAAVGAFAEQQRIGDVLVAVLFGVAGYYMKKHGWPRIPLVVALLLGASLERHLHVTLRLHALDRLDVLGRPVALLLLLLVAVTVGSSLIKRIPLPREASS
jgi:putative tricarboxylic transport membrane protein